MVQNIQLQLNLAQTPEVGRLQQSAAQLLVVHQEAAATKMETHSKEAETEVLTTQGPESRGLGQRSPWWKKKRQGIEKDTEIEAELSRLIDPFRGKIIDVWR